MNAAAAFAVSPRAVWRRVGALVRLEVENVVARPALFLCWMLLLMLFALVFASGSIPFLSDGDSATGGKRPWVTSEFAIAIITAFNAMVIHPFFYGILSGLSLIRDDEARVGEILTATPLRPGQYVWGRFLGVLAIGGAALLLGCVINIVFFHIVPNDSARDIRGPFHLWNYLGPTLVFGVPFMILLAGLTFTLGAVTRQSILVFVAPVAILVLCLLLASGKRVDAPEERLMLLRALEPSGLRWLTENYLNVDRGADFYNHQRIVYDTTFLISRVVWAGLGLLSVGLAHLQRARFGHTPRVRRSAPPASSPTQPWSSAPLPVAHLPIRTVAAAPTPLASLGMYSRTPGVWAGAVATARAEVTELLRQPALYLFLLLVGFYVVEDDRTRTGMFSTKLLLTPGQASAERAGLFGGFAALLLLIYAVESLERDRVTGLATIRHATSIRTWSLLLGKFLALQAVVVATALTLILMIGLGMLGQSPSYPFSLGPFVLTWGLLVGPALVCWLLFVMAAYVLTGHNRYATYGVGLLALMLLTIQSEQLSYLSNLFLNGGSLRWSDLSIYESDRIALVISRLLAGTLALLYAALAVRKFRRRDPDATRTLGRLRPGLQLRFALPLLPLLVIPLGLAIWLGRLQAWGPQGHRQEESEKNYWRKNLATYKDYPTPGVAGVDMAVTLEPARRSYSASGTLTLRNHRSDPITRIPITANLRWRHLKWTLDGKAYTPENRSGLYVFTPDTPLAPGKTLRVGFSYDCPDRGVTLGHGQGMEFVLPSAVVLTSFSPSFVPYVGYDSSIGVDEDNHYDSADRELSFYEQQKHRDVLFGSQLPFSLRIAVTAPDGFRVNTVGEKISEKVVGGKRTTVWQSDADPNAPVRDFNLVGGANLVESRGKSGTAVYYYPGHAYNVPEMLRALEASRKWYGTWFAPYPYKDLRLTEFPALAGYAQSFAGNISFGEEMGFLVRTEDQDEANDAFAVTAHEAAHQWWGNLVTPGDGPSGNILSEGLAHYSAALLVEKEQGDTARQQFLKTVERQYAEARHSDGEVPLAKLDGSKEGDTAVTYCRGGWVFYMLSEDVMGREAMLRGLKDYVARYHTGDDHPLLPDLLRILRPYARDPKAFDTFADQWVYATGLPQFHIADAHKKALPGKTKRWQVTFTLANKGQGPGAYPVAVELKDSKNSNGKDGRRTFLLTPGAKPTTVTWVVPFEPAKIVVDPDIHVLQLERDKAVAELDD